MSRREIERETTRFMALNTDGIRGRDVILTVVVWVAGLAGLGMILGFSGGPLIRRALAADGAAAGLAFAAVHLVLRAAARRLRGRPRGRRPQSS